jgi:hypothetical protein
MAVVTLKSAGITNATATPRVLNNANIYNGKLRGAQGMVAVANGDSIASVYRMFRIRSSDNVHALRLWCSAITSAAADVGLYDIDSVNAGAVVDVDFFASAQSLASALSATDIAFEAGAAGGLLTNAEKRIWEALGLTADPLKEYDVALTLTAAATAAGTVVLRSSYISGE